MEWLGPVHGGECVRREVFVIYVEIGVEYVELESRRKWAPGHSVEGPPSGRPCRLCARDASQILTTDQTADFAKST